MLRVRARTTFVDFPGSSQGIDNVFHRIHRTVRSLVAVATAHALRLPLRHSRKSASARRRAGRHRACARRCEVPHRRLDPIRRAPQRYNRAPGTQGIQGVAGNYDLTSPPVTNTVVAKASVSGRRNWRTSVGPSMIAANTGVWHHRNCSCIRSHCRGLDCRDWKNQRRTYQSSRHPRDVVATAFPARDVTPYIVVQCLGAIAGSASLLQLFGPMVNVGTTLPVIGVTNTSWPATWTRRRSWPPSKRATAWRN